jgi:hypothetical protein
MTGHRVGMVRPTLLTQTGHRVCSAARIFCAMLRWQPMASMVTMAPSIRYHVEQGRYGDDLI